MPGAPIPFNDLQRQHRALAEDLHAAVQRVLDSGWYVLGPEVEAFESEFAMWCGAAGSVGVANGTDAIELALRGVGVGRGDEVITVANAGGYTSVACLAIGATPVYVDVTEPTLGIDPAAAVAAVSDRTAAIVVTHLYGIVADVDGLRRGLPRDLPIVEDCAQAHGARRTGSRTGTSGDAAAFSFYPTKNLGAAGDGGAVVSNRADVLDRVRQLRQYGWRDRNTADLPGGRNSRLDELQAAVLRCKLPRVDGWNARRRAIAERWRQHLAPALPIVSSPPGTDAEDVFHLCVTRTPDREGLRRHLLEQGVATGCHFAVPDHEQPAFATAAAAAGRPAGAALPVTVAACREVLSLPCFPELRDDEIDRAAQALDDLIGSRS